MLSFPTGRPTWTGRRSKARARAWLASAAVATVALAVTACAGPGATGDQASARSLPSDCTDPSEVKAQVYTKNILNLVLFVADNKGFYDRNCVVVSRVDIPSAPVAIQQAVAGSVNLINTAPDNVLRTQAAGVDLDIVANMLDRMYYALVVSNKTDLPSKDLGYPAMMKDLVGKKIGVTSLGTNTEVIARANFLAAGLDPDSATYVALGTLPAMLAALENGTIDAVQMAGSAPEQAVALGLGTIYGDLRQDGVGSEEAQGLNGSTLVWAAMGDWIEDNEEAVTRFKDANDEAIEWIADKANRDELVQILADEAPMPEGTPNADEALAQVADLFAQMASSEVDFESLGNWIDYTMKYGDDLEKQVPLEDMIWSGAR